MDEKSPVPGMAQSVLCLWIKTITTTSIFEVSEVWALFQKLGILDHILKLKHSNFSLKLVAHLVENTKYSHQS